MKMISGQGGLSKICNSYGVQVSQTQKVRKKAKKRSFRALWIVRINAAARFYDLSYSMLINGLNKAEIEIDRKILADLAMNDIETFAAIAKEAKSQLAA